MFRPAFGFPPGARAAPLARGPRPGSPRAPPRSGENLKADCPEGWRNMIFMLDFRAHALLNQKLEQCIFFCSTLTKRACPETFECSLFTSSLQARTTTTGTMRNSVIEISRIGARIMFCSRRSPERFGSLLRSRSRLRGVRSAAERHAAARRGGQVGP